MDTHEQHLVEAEQHVAEGEKRVKHQRQLIETLARDGHDTTDAQALLETLQQSLQAMHEHRQRIMDTIAGETQETKGD